MTELVTWLTDSSTLDPALSGGKGSALSRMAQAELPVPQAFVVTSQAFGRAVGGRIDGALSRIRAAAPDDLDAIDEASSLAREAIYQAGLPAGLLADIRDAFEALGGDAVSVRSSATAEDLAAASFAGQYETYLNVSGFDDVAGRILDVWASLYSTRAIAYSGQNGLDHEKVGMAVVVQRQISPQASGVMFTRDPVTGARRFVVAVALGIGQGVVAGEVPADHLELDASAGDVLASSIASKDAMVVARDAGGVERVPVSEGNRDRPALGASAVTELFRLGGRLEALFGGPQDIEFALVDHSVQLLQSRPVTTGATTEDAESVRWEEAVDSRFSWTLSPMRVLQGPLYKLQLDAARAYLEGQRINYAEVAAERSRSHIMTVVNDYAYLRSPEIDETALAERQKRHVARCQAYIDQGTSIYAEVLAPQVEGELAKLRRLKAAGGSVAARVKYLEAAIEAAGLIMGHLHWCLGGMAIRLDWPAEFHEVTGEPPEEADVFLQAVPNKTTRLIARLRELARIVQRDQTLAAAFADRRYEVLEDPGHREVGAVRRFNSRFRSMMKEYGSRTGYGFGANVDFDSTTWRMEPRKPLDLIGSYAEQDVDELELLEKRALQARQRATRRMRRKLAGDPDRLQRFEQLRWQAQDGVGIMENHNHMMEQSTVGQMRDAIHEMGMALVKDGLLDRPIDALHFSLDELRRVAAGDGIRDDMRSLARQRSERRARLAKLDPPPTLGKPAESPPASPQDAEASETVGDGSRLPGRTASRGRATGPARIVHSSANAPRFHKGDILVAVNVGPDWTPFFPLLGGIVLDDGEIYQHPAIVAREFRIPAVFQTRRATSTIREGQTITVDGDGGVVDLLV
jgi:pyruvate,water dikinase